MPGGFGSNQDQSPCPCGGGMYRSCCGPLHRGDQRAISAEQLMRSRYSAFVQQKVDYLMATHLEDDIPSAERRRALRITCRQVRWKGLRILATERGRKNDRDGVVKFEACYNGGILRETSLFQRRGNHLEGEWLYIKALKSDDNEFMMST